MSVEAKEIPCRAGYLGLLTLNSPDTLNALSNAMVEQALSALERWRRDPRICLVVVQGAGPRAFCAGGNLHELYHGLTTGDKGIIQRAFAREYRLDYSLHHFPKPVVAMAHGVVMGGGLGLLSACRYRLATPDVTLAMPEISIGLFPDVGASWFLNRLPGRLGLFMGLTGARLNLADALRVGLVDLALLPEGGSTLLDTLTQQSWTGLPAADDSRLLQLLNEAPAPDYHKLPKSHLEQHEQTIARLCAGTDLPEIVARLLASPPHSDWWQACTDTLGRGCPVSAWLVWTQLQKARRMSLKAIFRMELAMALACCQRPDLREGIRARLIDRDNSPAWSFASVADVPAEVVAAHFHPEWDDHSDPMQLQELD